MRTSPGHRYRPLSANDDQNLEPRYSRGEDLPFEEDIALESDWHRLTLKQFIDTLIKVLKLVLGRRSEAFEGQ